jgi:hypothetical protein
MFFPPSKFSSCLFLHLLFLLLGCASPVFALGFNANWTYNQSGGDQVPTRHDFRQYYSLGIGLGKGLSYQPTEAISASVGVGYGRAMTSAGQNVTATDTLIPTGQISLTNDIFLAQLAASSTTSSSGNSLQGQTTQSWSSLLASRWDVPLFPKLRYTHSQDTDVEGTRADSTVVGVNWNLLVAKIRYNYLKRNAQGAADQNGSTSESHFGRLETGGSFFKHHVSLNVAQQVRFATAKGATLVEGQTLALVDDPLIGSPPEDVSLGGNSQLSDGVFDVNALEVPPDQRVFLGISFQFAQQIDVLHLYLDQVTSPTLTLHWDLYVRNPFDTGWELADLDIPATYDAEAHRYDLTVGKFEKGIMVVAVNDTGNPVAFTEMTAGSVGGQNFTTTSSNYLTNAGLGIKLTRTLSLAGSSTLEYFGTDAPEGKTTHNQKTVNGRLSWTPSSRFTQSLGLSQNTVQGTKAEKQLNRLYSYSLFAVLLPTVNTNFAASRVEQYTGQRRTHTSNSFSLGTYAQIYPDLNTNLLLFQRFDDQLKEDGTTASKRSFAADFNLDARLRRDVIAKLKCDYSRQSGETGSSQGAVTQLEVRYRPSSLLGIYGLYDLNLLATSEPGTLRLGGDLTVLRTEKARLTLRSSFRRKEQSSWNFTASGSWDISRHLSLATNTSYNLAASSTYSLYISLALQI